MYRPCVGSGVHLALWSCWTLHAHCQLRLPACCMQVHDTYVRLGLQDTQGRPGVEHRT